ncbi:hypothetical protein B0H15DRAFT_958464 [Mycena belliarum]|uniref:Uncharacterized protein n=1 Tax=Mycena belliarum TaxID=1033014 RepID=A0AAD6TQ56_9AGAR|nr:hypothetical protein B0H15DRAFT_958464 [Mycena belliae]
MEVEVHLDLRRLGGPALKDSLAALARNSTDSARDASPRRPRRQGGGRADVARRRPFKFGGAPRRLSEALQRAGTINADIVCCARRAPRTPSYVAAARPHAHSQRRPWTPIPALASPPSPMLPLNPTTYLCPSPLAQTDSVTKSRATIPLRAAVPRAGRLLKAHGTRDGRRISSALAPRSGALTARPVAEVLPGDIAAPRA